MLSHFAGLQGSGFEDSGVLGLGPGALGCSVVVDGECS